MRAYAWFLTILVACKPSATVESTMPVANLQSYLSLGLRVHTSASAFAAQGQAQFLENALTQKLREKCSTGFGQIGPTQDPKSADLLLDINITSVARGGGGIIVNPNLATIDALLVLSDTTGPIGTAKIKGKSSGMQINNSRPELEAIDAVAKVVSEMLYKSGCSGQRVAKASPPPPPPDGSNPPPGPGSDGGPGPGSNAPPPPDETKRAQAEQLNDQGKEKLYAADLAGALAAFQQANALLPDAKYEFNVCLALGAQEQWDSALAACKQARGMNPDAGLAAKIDRRVELLAQRH